MISPVTFILTKMFAFYFNLDTLSLMNFDKVKNKLTLNFSWLKPKEPTLLLLLVCVLMVAPCFLTPPQTDKTCLCYFLFSLL